MAARLIGLLLITVARVLTVPLEAAFQGTYFLYLCRTCTCVYLCLYLVRFYPWTKASTKPSLAVKSLFLLFLNHTSKSRNPPEIDKIEYHDSPLEVGHLFSLNNLSDAPTCFFIHCIHFVQLPGHLKAQSINQYVSKTFSSNVSKI